MLDPGHPSGTKPPVPQSCTSPVCPIADHELPGALPTSWPMVGATLNLSAKERVAGKLPSDRMLGLFCYAAWRGVGWQVPQGRQEQM